jgi:hypothetical protein
MILVRFFGFEVPMVFAANFKSTALAREREESTDQQDVTGLTPQL